MALDIKLNGEALDIDLAGVSSLADLIEKIADGFMEEVEMVTQMTINGKVAGDDDISGGGDIPVSEIETLELTTIKNPAEQVANLLRLMGGYLENFSEGLEGVSDQFRMGSPEAANSALGNGIEGLSSFVELLESARHVTKSDFSDIRYKDESVKASENRLLDITKSIKAGQEEKDWITVADLLEYELAPLIAQWKEILPLLETEVLKTLN